MTWCVFVLCLSYPVWTPGWVALGGWGWVLVAGETLVQVQQPLGPEQQHFLLHPMVQWHLASYSEVSVTFGILTPDLHKQEDPAMQSWQDTNQSTTRPAAAIRSCWAADDNIRLWIDSIKPHVCFNAIPDTGLVSGIWQDDWPIITLVTPPRH